jgi:hypothetical protein
VRVWFAGCRAAVQLGHRKRGCGQANRGGFTSASASRAPGLHPRNEDLDAPCQERSESHECHTLKGIFHGGSPHPAPSLNHPLRNGLARVDDGLLHFAEGSSPVEKTLPDTGGAAAMV